jgi:hypothetical protein
LTSSFNFLPPFFDFLPPFFDFLPAYLAAFLAALALSASHFSSAAFFTYS